MSAEPNAGPASPPRTWGTRSLWAEPMGQSAPGSCEPGQWALLGLHDPRHSLARQGTFPRCGWDTARSCGSALSKDRDAGSILPLSQLQEGDGASVVRGKRIRWQTGGPGCPQKVRGPRPTWEGQETGSATVPSQGSHDGPGSDAHKTFSSPCNQGKDHWMGILIIYYITMSY